MKDSSQDRFTPLSLIPGVQIYVVQGAYFTNVSDFPHYRR